MIQPKKISSWLLEKVSAYNLFIPEEDDYADDDNEVQEPALALQRQTRSTWLYICLLAVSMYMLVYAALMRPQSQTKIVSPVDFSLFTQLYRVLQDALVCPCSNAAIPYGDFVTITTELHPVCSSLFVTQKWINALYFSNASLYLIPDFRTTANAQFQLLASLCAFSAEAVSQNQIVLNNSELVSVYVLLQSQVQAEVNASREILQNSVLNRINSFLSYLRISTRANYLVSALNTNWQILVYYNEDELKIVSGRTAFNPEGNVEYDMTTTEMCGTANPTSPAGFFTSDSAVGFLLRLAWSAPMPNDILVNGFFTGCTPLEALLRSTLACLYDTSCLGLLTFYFPLLHQMNLDWNQHALRSNSTLASVETLLSHLFIEQQTIAVDYSKYFDACSPSYCTYTSIDRIDLSYAIALFISLYGGLIIVLRLVALALVSIMSKRETYSPLDLFQSGLQWQLILARLVGWVIRLNLFKKINERTAHHIRRQRIITRVFLVLLIVSMIALLVYTSLDTRLTITNASDPSLPTFEDLQNRYPDTIRCPCSSVTITYGSFVSLSPIFHQVCASDFVSDQWLTVLQGSVNTQIDIDWINRAHSQFQLLSDLCQLANQTTTEFKNQFLAQSFVTSNALTRDEFEKQLNVTLDQFFHSVTVQFTLLVETVSLLIQVDAKLMGTMQNRAISGNALFIINNVTNVTNELTFLLNRIDTLNSTSTTCVCATSTRCQTPVAIYQSVIDYADYDSNPSILYVVPGSQRGCSATESLRLSTLECLYSTSECFTLLLKYIEEIYVFNTEFPIPFNFRPLVYNATSSQFSPYVPVSILVENLLIERWSLSWSYQHFYDSCAPRSCLYSVTTRRNSLFGVILALMSAIGGLTFVSRLVTPLLIKLTVRLLSTSIRVSQQQVPMKWFRRMERALLGVIMHIYGVFINLNIFPRRYFGTRVDSDTARRLGQWSTRLYTVAFLLILAVFALYNLTLSRAATLTFRSPSFLYYNHLQHEYRDELKCFCSAIASKYAEFIAIEPHFHQICESDFVMTPWRDNFTAGLVSNLSAYGQRDYRRFLFAHLQFLQGLCQSSRRSVNDSVEQLRSSLFITAELLAEEAFRRRLFSLIDQNRLSAPVNYIRLHSLIRTINHGNAIASTYGTNFEYAFQGSKMTSFYTATQSVTYNDGCTCQLASNCTTQATFTEGNISITIPGLRMGCLPSESLRLSTLQCFYDQACLDVIRDYTNSTQRPRPLSSACSRFSTNTTIDELIENLFVEQWNVSMSYSLYFSRCAPLLCSYTYREQFNVLHALISMLGLQGGLSIVLKWLCPKIIRIASALFHHHGPDRQSLSTASSLRKASRRSFLIGILFALVIIGLVIFSVRTAPQEDNQTTTTTTALATTAENSTITPLKATTEITGTSSQMLPLCQPDFRSVVVTPHGSLNADVDSPLLGDFNNDHRLDFGYISKGLSGITVFLGDGMGGFQTATKFSPILSIGVVSPAVADVDNDRNLDIVFGTAECNCISVSLGNGDGTFTSPIVSIGKNNMYIRDIAVSDFNSDTYLDLVSVSFLSGNVSLYLGYGNGSFAREKTISTGTNNILISVTVGHINSDLHTDFAAANMGTRTVDVFLGDGQGSFEPKITSFTGGALQPIAVYLGDLNRDNNTDAVVTYLFKCNFAVMLGHGNGTFKRQIIYSTNTSAAESSIVLADFNGDAYLDIAFDTAIKIGMFATQYAEFLLSDGYRQFQRRAPFSIVLHPAARMRSVGDFNNDGCPDIVNFDENFASLSILLNSCLCPKTR